MSVVGDCRQNIRQLYFVKIYAKCAHRYIHIQAYISLVHGHVYLSIFVKKLLYIMPVIANNSIEDNSDQYFRMK